MTKRQWRRIRGKLISRNSDFTGLHNIRFSSMVMTNLSNVFYFNRPHDNHLDFWYQ